MEINQANQVGYVPTAKQTSDIAAASGTNTNLLPTTQALKQKSESDLTISERVVIKAVEKANKVRAGMESNVEYSVHRPSGDIIVKVMNKDTKEVIHEYPSEKLLELIDKLQEINGRVVDEKR
ncbi:putative FlaG/YvyC family protein [Paenibacillus taihuensis]|uniref:Putative FlaG/YvyC family protein n=1 Tax=Paenibacillus taihuensis TaxID=1156355 RepID=A0A3D9S5C5_9BACL|nr:flagellar protein FlaG [Paenibacillus taihuensis]REE84486.1 putative FlaG/YvyC family protein [Paenibacillus taihuensis]